MALKILREIKVKKRIGCLVMTALLQAAFMVGCNDEPPSGSVGPQNAISNQTSAPTVTVTIQSVQTAVNLGTSGVYAVLSGQGITNAEENICGSLGNYPLGLTSVIGAWTFSPLCAGA